jgi:hypothetical protein
MEKETSKVYKLAMPLIIEGRGSCLYISDGTFGREFELKDFRCLKITGFDPDGFVTFEMVSPRPQEHIVSTALVQTRFADSGFVLMSSSTAKSPSGASRGIYDYYKRAGDMTYYTVLRQGTATKRIRLGSLTDSKSHISQIAQAMKGFFDPLSEKWFDRKDLLPHLTHALTHGQKLKSVLDILVLEGFLERRETHERGKVHEEYKVTSKLGRTSSWS